MQEKELKAFAFACIDKVVQSGISRLSLQNGEFSLTIENGTAGTVVQTAAPQTTGAAEPQEEQMTGTVVPAPLVGTFYASSAPGQPPLASVGDTVKKGDILCVIEAMKIMNSIESPCDGTITRVLVSDAQPVEFHQPLFVIE